MFFENAKDLREIQGTYYTAPPTAFDPVMGYRWLPGPSRLVRIIRGEVVIDASVRGNNYGYPCSYDYSPRKRSDRTFRFITFGDSFTAGLYMASPWPETLQTLLRSHPEFARDIEVYPFPIDGGGLLNWYSLFKHQVLPEFEFDALIIPDWHDDLGRKWMILHANDEGMFMHRCEYDERPKSEAEFAGLRPKLKRMFTIADVARTDELVKRARANVQPAIIPPDYYLKEEMEDPVATDADGPFTPQLFMERFGQQRWSMLSEIITICRERNVPVIFSKLPTRDGLLKKHLQHVELRHQVFAKGLSDHLGMHYFDGYDVFRGIDPHAITDYYWLKYDAHWGEAAAALYANKLAEWIVCQGMIPNSL